MKETRYRKIYLDILDDIKSGRVKIGDKMPTEQQLSKKYGVSRITSKKAFEMLVQEGLVNRIPGKGTFVTSDTREEKIKTGNVIGIVMSDFSSDFGADFIRGVQGECARRNGIVAVSSCYNTQEEETKEITRLISNGVKGLIIMPVHGISYNPAILTNVLNAFPLVLADRYLSGLCVSFVGTKNLQSAASAVNYLFSMGHRHIAFISSAVSTTALRERLDGYIDAYAQSDNPLNKRLINSNVRYTMPGMAKEDILKADVSRLSAFFDENPQVTAVLAADFHVAMVVQQALDEMGKRMPEDISIICYDRLENSRYAYTYIRQRQYEMGKHASRLLMDSIEGKRTQPETVLLEFELVPGESVAKIK